LVVDASCRLQATVVAAPAADIDDKGLGPEEFRKSFAKVL
jgi:hypothetical protein